MTKLLIAEKADVNIESNRGNTPFTTAVDFRNIGCTELLLAAKANVNIKDDLGWTSLMYAVEDDQTAMIRLLLNAGANPYIANNRGETAFSLAKAHPAIVTLLEEHMAKLSMDVFLMGLHKRAGAGSSIGRAFSEKNPLAELRVTEMISEHTGVDLRKALALPTPETSNQVVSRRGYIQEL
jgi:hypothetical protein